MKRDIHFSPPIFSALTLFLKAASEIPGAAKAKTKNTQLGYIAPWPEPKRSTLWVLTREF